MVAPLFEARLAMPVSVNRMFEYRRAKKESDAYSAYKTSVSLYLNTIVDAPLAGLLHVEYYFSGVRKNADLDNLLKCLNDAMQPRVFENDKQIRRMSIVAIPKRRKGEPFVYVRVFPFSLPVIPEEVF